MITSPRVCVCFFSYQRIVCHSSISYKFFYFSRKYHDRLQQQFWLFHFFLRLRTAATPTCGQFAQLYHHLNLFLLFFFLIRVLFRLQLTRSPVDICSSQRFEIWFNMHELSHREKVHTAYITAEKYETNMFIHIHHVNDHHRHSSAFIGCNIGFSIFCCCCFHWVSIWRCCKYFLHCINHFRGRINMSTVMWSTCVRMITISGWWASCDPEKCVSYPTQTLNVYHLATRNSTTEPQLNVTGNTCNHFFRF